MNHVTFGRPSILFLSLILFSALGANGQPGQPALSGDAAAAREAFQEADWETAISGYSAIVSANPADGASWYQLGRSFHQSGQYEKAIPAFQQSDSLGVAPAASQYNIACGFALLGKERPAMEWLAQSVESGFNQLAILETDTDLNNIRDEEGFDTIVEKVRRQSKPCLYDPKYAAMDFWLGEWDVFVGGRLAGHNMITKVSDGCALLEDWKSAQGTTGMSLNFYDPAVSKWKQTWIGGFVGEYVEESHATGEIVFGYEGVTPNGKPVLNKLSFKLLEDGTVRQIFSASTDGGENWNITFDGRYVKKQ